MLFPLIIENRSKNVKFESKMHSCSSLHEKWAYKYLPQNGFRESTYLQESQMTPTDQILSVDLKNITTP